MPRGITEKDVFTACDALVLAGERPTIERVRQKIGRGSPNTVSPMLDAWFKGLGRRLQDPGAFAPAPDVPEPLVQAATHFWEIAQAQARHDLESRLADGLRAMTRDVEEARLELETAASAQEAEAERATQARLEADLIAARLDAERLAHVAVQARLDEAQAQLADLQSRLAAERGRADEAADRARKDTLAANERASGAERRAALEIEAERAARTRADKRVQALEQRVESLQQKFATQSEALAATRTSLEHTQRDNVRLTEANDVSTQERQAVERALVQSTVAVERAQSEARTAREVIACLGPLVC